MGKLGWPLKWGGGGGGIFRGNHLGEDLVLLGKI